MLHPKSEELLSWLQGRRPLGEPVEMHTAHIMADLGIAYRERVSRLARPLIEQGYVERLSVGGSGPKTTVRVLRRLESFAGKRRAEVAA